MIRSSRRSIILRLRTPALDAWPDQSSGLSTLRERRWAWTGRAIEVVVVGRGPVRLRAAERGADRLDEGASGGRVRRHAQVELGQWSKSESRRFGHISTTLQKLALPRIT